MNAQDAQQMRLAAPLDPDPKLLENEEIVAVMARLSAAVHKPQPCAYPSKLEIVRVIGQQIALDLWMPELGARLLRLYESLMHEHQILWCAGWTSAEPWPAQTYAAWQAVRGDDGRSYADYLVLRGFYRPEPDTYSQRQIFLDSLCDAVESRAAEVGDAYRIQCDDARKAIGPALSAGRSVTAVAAIVRVRCPLLTDRDLAAILNEEGTWWERWRHDHRLGAAE